MPVRVCHSQSSRKAHTNSRESHVFREEQLERGEARLFVLDFVTAVSAAEEEEGEREEEGEGATHYSGSLGRETVGLRSSLR